MATVAECSSHLFVSVTRLRDLIAGGQITHKPSGQYEFDTVRRQYIEYLQKAAQGRGGEDGGNQLSKQRARLTEAKALAAERKNYETSAEFVRLSAVGKVTDEMFSNMREIALGVAGMISDSVSAHCDEDRAQVHDIVEDAMREMLETLAAGDLTSRSRSHGRQKGRRMEPAE